MREYRRQRRAYRRSDAPMRRLLLPRALLLLVALVSTLCLAHPAVAQAEPPDDLTIDQMHLFVLPAGDRLQVTEHYLLGNAGTETYTGDTSDGGEESTVVFPLPTGATNIRVDEENQQIERYIVGEDSIADTQAIPPGTATVEVRFAYELPSALGSTIERTVPLNVKSAVLLVAGEQWGLEGELLAPFGSMEAGGEPARAYTIVEPLAAGDTFSFAVVERTAEPTTPRGPAQQTPNPTAELGLGLIALAAAGVGVFMLRRSSRVPEIPDQLRGEVAAIAALDRQFAAGEISEDAYREARESLKAEIAARLRGAGGDD